MKEREWIDKEMLLEAAKKLDSYAWSDFASLVDGLPAFTAEQWLNEETVTAAKAAEQITAERFCECTNPDECPLVAYERKERRYWQLLAQRRAADLDSAQELVKALRADAQRYKSEVRGLCAMLDKD